MKKIAVFIKKHFIWVVEKARAFKPSPTVMLGILFVLSILLTNIPINDAPVSASKRVPIYRVDRDDKYISLTVDAAWGNEYTKEILNILDEYGVRITFFTVDFWANDYPDDIKALKLGGHEIANHSATHPDMAKLSVAEMERELLETWQTQQKYAGSSAVRLFRAPYGSYSNDLIDTCERHGFKTIQWDVDSLDWKEGETASSVISRVLKNVSSGSIILMHNNSPVITSVLPTVLETLINEGYTFVPVSQLIYHSNYTVDANGVQRKAN